MKPISQQAGVKFNYLLDFPKLNLTYVEIPKCGSTGVKHALLRAEHGRRPSGVGIPLIREEFPDSVVTSIPQGRMVIALVRNPFQRLESAYRSRWLMRHPDDTFSQMVAQMGDILEMSPDDIWNNHFRPCSHFLPRGDDGSLACTVFRLEDQVDDVARVISEKSGKKIDLPVVHKSDPDKGNVSWSEDNVKDVKKYFAEDFEIGSYSLER